MTTPSTNRVTAVLEAAERVYNARESLVDVLVAETGLSREGVDRGFRDHWERLAGGVAPELFAAVSPAPAVYVVLAANVFVAPVRALVLAAASAPMVRVRASRRAPTVLRALLAELKDSLDIQEFEGEHWPAATPEDALHAYGGDAAIAALGAAFPGVVYGHGHGFGVAWIDATCSDLGAAARALAADIAPFDQAGCLSPRIALVEGDAARREAFAELLGVALADEAAQTPRGALGDVDLRRAFDEAAFLGELREGPDHALWLPDAGTPIATLLPTGRNLALYSVQDARDASVQLAPMARYITTVGGADDALCAALGLSGARPFATARECSGTGVARDGAPPSTGARAAKLGFMQRPPLDGPVDRRTQPR